MQFTRALQIVSGVLWVVVAILCFHTVLNRSPDNLAYVILMVAIALCVHLVERTTATSVSLIGKLIFGSKD